MVQYTNIFEAIEADDIEAVMAFLPAQLETRDENSGTPLHIACVWGRTEIARLLLDYGADIEARDEDKQTPLHLSCCYYECETSELLVKRGANLFVIDQWGKSPLDMVKDKEWNKVPYSQILLELHAEYLNKHTLEASERTAVITSGWEMEM